MFPITIIEGEITAPFGTVLAGYAAGGEASCIMIDEITGPSHRDLERPGRADKARGPSATGDGAGCEPTEPPSIEVSSELKQLIERVKSAQTYRKEVVHRVLERLQKGELITSESVREAAETILREGL